MNEPLRPAPGFRLPKLRLFLLMLSPFLLLGGVIASGYAANLVLPERPAGPYSATGLTTGTSLPDVEVENPDGNKLFLLHCANCHGAKGDGVGLAGLNPRARYFGYDKFKFVSTTNTAKTGGGMPTDEDLFGTLQRGIAGSPMPS